MPSPKVYNYPFNATPVPGAPLPLDHVPSKVQVSESVGLESLSQTLNVSESLRRPLSVSYKADLSGKIMDPPGLDHLPSSEAVRRKMLYIRARQAEYDRYNALPRKLPDRTWDEAEFAAMLDAVMEDNEMKRGAVLKVKLKEAMEEQIAERRHGEWTRQVYLPIATTVAASVDAAFPAIHRDRQRAMEGYLRATDPENVTGGKVFLHGNTAGGAQSYDPWAINARSTIRASVPIKDPLKTVLQKRVEEGRILRGGAGGSGGGGDTQAASLHPHRARVHEVLDRSPQRLDPTGYVLGNLETQPFGHFEVAEARFGGAMDMKFSGKDTESTWRGYDFDTPASFAQTGSMGRPGVGRVREVDAEFPIGKRQEEDPQRQPGKLYTHKGSFDVTKRTTVHRVQEGVYDYKGGKDGKDGVFTDGALLDTVRPTYMAAVPPSLPTQGYGNPNGGLAGRNKYAQDPYPKVVGEQLGVSYRRAIQVQPAEEGSPKFRSGRTTLGTTLNTQTGFLSLK